MVKVVEQFDQHRPRWWSPATAPPAATWWPRSGATRRCRQTISTVDNANTVQGQLVTALALAEQITTDEAGQYGVGADAASLLPKLRQ